MRNEEVSDCECTNEILRQNSTILSCLKAPILEALRLSRSKNDNFNSVIYLKKLSTKRDNIFSPEYRQKGSSKCLLAVYFLF